MGQQPVERGWKQRGRILVAATTHVWSNGIADGDWNNVGNWASGALPGSGGVGLDTVIFDGSVTQTGPSVNMDRSGDTVLYRIIVRPNFTGDIGGPGNYLVHSGYTGSSEQSRAIHRGSGNVYFRNTAGWATTWIMDGTGHLYLDTEFDAVFGQINSVYIKRGTVTAGSTCSILKWVVLDGPAATLTVAAKDGSEDDPDWIAVFAGTFTNNRVISGAGRAVVFGGKLDQRGAVADSAVMISGPAGRIVYTPNTTLGAGHNPDILVAGRLDTSDSNQDIEPASLVITQMGSIIGTAMQVGDSTYVDIDLAEEYP
jgi:hypothetical protein